MTEKTTAEALQEQVELLSERLKIVGKQRNDALNREVIASANAAVLQKLLGDSAMEIGRLRKRLAEADAAKQPEPADA